MILPDTVRLSVFMARRVLPRIIVLLPKDTTQPWMLTSSPQGTHKMLRHCVAALANGITIDCVLATCDETSCECCTHQYQIEKALVCYFKNISAQNMACRYPLINYGI